MLYSPLGSFAFSAFDKARCSRMMDWIEFDAKKVASCVASRDQC